MLHNEYLKIFIFISACMLYYLYKLRNGRNIVNGKILKIFIVVAIVTFCFDIASKIYRHYSGYFLSSYIVNFTHNALELFRNTKVETENFIIDVPVFGWVALENRLKTDNIFLTKHLIINDKNGKETPVALIILLGKFNKYINFDQQTYALNEFKKNCEIDVTKTTQAINNFEADIYACNNTDKPAERYIIYKNEFFYFVYSDPFKHLYDKFFDGVWLKE